MNLYEVKMVGNIIETVRANFFRCENRCMKFYIFRLCKNTITTEQVLNAAYPCDGVISVKLMEQEPV